MTKVIFANHCGDDVRKFEPKTWFKFKDLDKSIQELRVMYKAHPEWFEVPKAKQQKVLGIDPRDPFAS